MVSILASALFLLIAVRAEAQDASSLASSSTGTTYYCFQDRNGDNVYTAAGEISVCTEVTGTTGGELCPIDLTDCVISMPTATACPSNTSYDAAANRCVMPPICSSGALDNATNTCISRFAGACSPGASINNTTGICESIPSCSAGAYNVTLQTCVETSSPICVPGTQLNQASNRCEAAPVCPTGGAYSSTNDICLYSPGSNLPLTCPGGSELISSTNQCRTTTYYAPLCSDSNAAITIINSVPVCMDASTTCSSDMTYSTEYKACICPATCPSGSELNPNLTSIQDACVGYTYTIACPSDFTPDIVTGGCEAVPACPAGSNLDGNTHLCAAAPSCSKGSYDVISKQCVDMSTPPACSTNTTFNPATGLCDSYPICADSQFDPEQGVCVKTVLPTCPFGGYLNLSKHRCEAIPGCSSGNENPSDSMCAFTGPAVYPANCLSGTTLNTATSVCDAAPQCSSGTYDASTHLCSTALTTAASCPSQTTLNLSTGKCEAAYACPSCSSYSSIGNDCVYGTSPTSPVCPSPGSFNTYFNWPGCYVTEWIWNGCPSGYSLVWYDNWVGLLCRADASCPCGYHLNGSSCDPDSSVPVACPNGTTFDPAIPVCEAAPSCPSGYTYNASATSAQTACISIQSSSPTCLTGTTLNSSDGRCETQPTCTKGTFDPTRNACASYDWTCPLGPQYACLDNDAVYQCSALACESQSSLPPSENDTGPTGYQSNNGSIDPTTGQCEGQLAIFPGKPSYCKPPGIRTVGTNCCSAAHGGKFSRYEDMDQVMNRFFDSYMVYSNTNITNDGTTIAINTNYSGNTTPYATQETHAVTPGVPVTWELLPTYAGNDPGTDADASIDYSSVTDSGGMTTITSDVSNYLNAGPYLRSYTMDVNRNTVSQTTFKAKGTSLVQKFGFDSSTGTNVNDIALSQYHYTMDAAGVYDPATKLTTFTPTEHVAYSIDTSSATCTIVNPSFEGYSECQLQCMTGLSNGNLIMKVVYRYLPTGDIITTAATVTKSASGTAAQIDTYPGGCDDWISYGYRTYADNDVKEPFITASTAYNTDGSFNNNTIFAAQSLGEMHTWPALWAAVEAYAAYITSPCRPHEQTTDLARDAGKCHYLGRFCISHWGHYCVQDKESYCCFGSKLARIIQEQGRPQLSAFGRDGGWGVPESPNCVGLTPDQFSMLDFSQMDLSEFYADIVPPNAEQIQQNIANGINNFYSNTVNGSGSGAGTVISNPTGTSLVSGPTGT